MEGLFAMDDMDAEIRADCWMAAGRARAVLLEASTLSMTVDGVYSVAIVNALSVSPHSSVKCEAYLRERLCLFFMISPL